MADTKGRPLKDAHLTPADLDRLVENRGEKVLATAIVLHLHKNWASFDKRVFVRLLLPTLIPIIWFELLSNHTQTHSHFTYRSESAAIALVFAAAIMATNPPTNVRLLLGNLRGHLWRAAPPR